MSSLVETASQEDAPVSTAQTIPSHGSNSDIMPKRPWGGYSFVNFTSSKGTPAPHSQRRIRSPKMRSKSNTANQITTKSSTDAFTWAHLAEHVDKNAFKEDQGIDEFVSFFSSQGLANNSHSGSQPEMDDLVAMLKNHHVSDTGPTTETTGTLKDDHPTANIPLVSFNFNFNDRLQTNLDNAKATKAAHKVATKAAHKVATTAAPDTQEIPAQLSNSNAPLTPSTSSTTHQAGFGVPPTSNKLQPNVNMPSDYKFSFSANIPCQKDAVDLKNYEMPRTAVYIRPLTPGNNHDKPLSDTDHAPHPLSQMSFPKAPVLAQKDVSAENYRANEPGFAVRERRTGSNDASFVHLQHRRILPMPKPSHKRRAIKKESIFGTLPQLTNASTETTKSSASANTSVGSTFPPTTSSTPSTAATATTATNTTTTSTTGAAATATDSSTTPHVWQSKAQTNNTFGATCNTQNSTGQRENWDTNTAATFNGTNSSQNGFKYENIEAQQSVGPIDAIYREKTKKMKRSVANDLETKTNNAEERKDNRRKDRGRKAGEDDGESMHHAGGRFSDKIFDFSIDENTKEKWKKLPELEEIQLSKRSIGLTEVLKQAKSPKATPRVVRPSKFRERNRIDPVRLPSDPISSVPLPLPLPPLPPPPPPPPPPIPQQLSSKGKKSSNTPKKKKGKQTGPPNVVTKAQKSNVDLERKRPVQHSKVSISSSSSSLPLPLPSSIKPNNSTLMSAASSAGTSETITSGKKGKKAQRRKNQEDQGLSSGYDLFSEVSVIRNINPDDWTCLFCQFEIFCNGIEVARRKGGFYRRRRERQRKLREVEAKRNGEAMVRLQSDDEDRIVGGINGDRDHSIFPKKPLGPVPLTSIPTSTAEPGPTRHIRRNNHST
ncbi:hypothetical protein F4703DRAFT_1883910 [Phycomyces blakesleeanus]